MQNNGDSLFFNPLLTICMIHGWGYAPNMWNHVAHDFAKAMPKADISTFDLGFFGGFNAPSGDCDLMITHSLGTLWCLLQRPQPARGLVIVNGFTDFGLFSTPEILTRMKRGVIETPEKQMRSFWRQCGFVPSVDMKRLDQTRLVEGLDWLAAWDARQALKDLDCPILILAGAQDRICEIEAMKAHWDGYEIAIHAEGGHALPQTHPQWCMEQIEDWICRHP